MPPVVVELPPLTRLDVDWTLIQGQQKLEQSCRVRAALHILLPWLQIFYHRYLCLRPGTGMPCYVLSTQSCANYRFEPQNKT